MPLNGSRTGQAMRYELSEPSTDYRQQPGSIRTASPSPRSRYLKV
jgi:hypothetical protein